MHSSCSHDSLQVNRNASDKHGAPITSIKNPYNSEPSRVVPIPEGRMRAQEASRYSNSLEANISNRAGLAAVAAAAASSSMTAYRRSDHVLPEKAANSARNQEQQSRAVAKNPFDEEDVTNDYDESKNPFADETDGNILRKDEKNRNPFDDVDDNSNPFS